MGFLKVRVPNTWSKSFTSRGKAGSWVLSWLMSRSAKVGVYGKFVSQTLLPVSLWIFSFSWYVTQLLSRFLSEVSQLISGFLSEVFISQVAVDLECLWEVVYWRTSCVNILNPNLHWLLFLKINLLLAYKIKLFGSSLLCGGFSFYLEWAGATLHCGAQLSHWGGLFCGARL